MPSGNIIAIYIPILSCGSEQPYSSHKNITEYAFLFQFFLQVAKCWWLSTEIPKIPNRTVIACSKNYFNV